MNRLIHSGVGVALAGGVLLGCGSDKEQTIPDAITEARAKAEILCGNLAIAEAIDKFEIADNNPETEVDETYASIKAIESDGQEFVDKSTTECVVAEVLAPLGLTLSPEFEEKINIPEFNRAVVETASEGK